MATTGYCIKRGAGRRYCAVGRYAIGLVVNLELKYPHSRDARDLQATRRVDAYLNRQQRRLPQGRLNAAFWMLRLRAA